MMYQTIAQIKPIYHLYADKLIKLNVASEGQVKALWDHHLAKVATAYSESSKSTFDITKWRSPVYHSVVDYTKLGTLKNTGIVREDLMDIGAKLTTIPADFHIHPTLKKIYDVRRKSIETG